MNGITTLTNKKNYSNFLQYLIPKNYLSKNRQLIEHPEYKNAKYTKIKDNIEKKANIKEAKLNKDETIGFIHVDSNGIPQIKKNYYDILGLTQKSTSQEIRSNFLKVAKKYHPDKHPESLVK